MKRLNLGCGNEPIPGWINHDLAELPGVDIVFDLMSRPWPFANDSFCEVALIHVLEHLDHTVSTLEELHRICADNAKLTIRVPYWNSPDMFTDPTHRSFFNEHTFEYFDPRERHCRERPYYSSARFAIRKKHYYIRVLYYIRVSAVWLQKILEYAARYLGGIIWVLEFELVALKDPGRVAPRQ